MAFDQISLKMPAVCLFLCFVGLVFCEDNPFKAVFNTVQDEYDRQNNQVRIRNDDGSDLVLSVGAIVGIGIGSVLFFIFCCVCILRCCCGCCRRDAATYVHTTTVLNPHPHPPPQQTAFVSVAHQFPPPHQHHPGQQQGGPVLAGVPAQHPQPLPGGYYNHPQPQQFNQGGGVGYPQPQSPQSQLAGGIFQSQQPAYAPLYEDPPPQYSSK